MKRFFELLLAGRFFLLLQLTVARILPARLFRLGKSAYLRLDRNKHHSVVPDESLEIRRGEETDVVDLVRDLYENDKSVQEFYGNFYRQGIEPWIAKRAGKVIGVVWLYRGHYIAPWQGYDGFVLRLEIETTGRFVANVFVAPESRRHGIFSKIAGRFLSESPKEEFYTCVDEDNTRSIRAHEKIGFRRYGAIYYIQIFGRTWAVFVTRRRMPKFFRMPRGETVSVILGNVRQGVQD